MRRTLLIAPALVGSAALLLAAGCTKTQSANADLETGQGVPAVSVDGTPISARFLADTGSKSCTEVTSGHIEVTFTGAGEDGSAKGGSVSAAMSGDFDTATSQSDFTIDLGATAAGSGGTSSFGKLGQDLAAMIGGKAQIVTVGDTLYINWPLVTDLAGASTPWVSISADSATTKDSIDQIAPIAGSCDVLDLLKGADGEVTDLGAETVDGVDSTHYRVLVDLTQAAGEAAPDHQAEIGKALQNFGGATSAPVDVWVGTDGIARRVTVSYGGSGKAALAMTMDLTAVNQPVSITAPPTDQVTPFDLHGLLGGHGGGNSGGSGRGFGGLFGGDGPN